MDSNLRRPRIVWKCRKRLGTGTAVPKSCVERGEEKPAINNLFLSPLIYFNEDEQYLEIPTNLVFFHPR
jgi:hypothetical protein